MDTDTAINWVGLVSAALISMMFIPQIVHVHKTKDTHAINYGFLNLNVMASALGLIYSIHFKVVPMIVANTSAGLFSISLAGMKFVNGLKEESSIDDISAPIV
jgi:MtN3 and saliva related transmembrane protein